MIPLALASDAAELLVGWSEGVIRVPPMMERIKAKMHGIWKRWITRVRMEFGEMKSFLLIC